MRMLLTARFDNATATAAIEDGSLSKTFQAAITSMNPEAAYFTSTNGQRTAFIVFDMQESSQLPVLAEPFFASGASVAVRPVMNLEDLQTGLANLGR
ncbi:hypothetical protein ACPA54_08760 [Uniformispora flossi]|uniref:hypothetical protein n=1 Tax=Uniformispora flossi TaxID=3390723 RepID=UPI003C3005D3